MEEGALNAPGHRYSERRREMGPPFGNTFNPRGLLASQVGKAPSSDVPRPLAKLGVMSFLGPDGVAMDTAGPARFARLPDLLLA
jgi:hypothetical protein